MRQHVLNLVGAMMVAASGLYLVATPAQAADETGCYENGSKCSNGLQCCSEICERFDPPLGSRCTNG